MNLKHLFSCCSMLALLIGSQTVVADITDAQRAYQEQRHEQAFSEFKALAQLGSDSARHHLATMYMHGQATDVDLDQAYGWAKLVNYDIYPEWNNITEQLRSNMNDQELAQAEQVAQDMQQQYGDAAIADQWAPEPPVAADASGSKDTDFEIQVIHRQAPKYPRKEMIYGTQGWVTVQFDVFPDGSTRNPVVIDSLPEGVFDEVTLDAIAGFKFAVDFKPGVEPYPVCTTQSIQYTLKGLDSPEMKNTIQQRIASLKSKADQGNPTAQYYYAMTASDLSLVKDQARMNKAEMNQWLYQAAQNGQTDAMYQLGQHLMTGKGAKQDKPKGMAWVILAANQGHARAARLASQHPKLANQVNGSNHSAAHWLKAAAENGHLDSQLEYAHLLAQDGDSSQTEAAWLYLDKFTKERDKSIKYYQTAALLYQLEGKEKQAKKAQKKANKMAKKLGWEI